MALRKISFQKLYRLVRRDAGFFNALLRDPEKALKARGWYLTKSDLQRLKRALRKVYRINGKQIARFLVQGRTGVFPWPLLRPWPNAKRLPWP